MSIQIPAEAAKRLDELANQLLTKVVPEPPSMPAKERFRPDIYPVAHIPEQDIIGELVEIRSVVNGSGQEVGRFFQQNDPKVGLVGEGFRALTDLARKIHKLEHLRETTSFGFILDTVFEWVEGKYKNARPERLTEYVLKRTEEEIKDFEIWFPLHRTLRY